MQGIILVRLPGGVIPSLRTGRVQANVVKDSEIPHLVTIANDTNISLLSVSQLSVATISLRLDCCLTTEVRLGEHILSILIATTLMSIATTGVVSTLQGYLCSPTFLPLHAASSADMCNVLWIATGP